MVCHLCRTCLVLSGEQNFSEYHFSNRPHLVHGGECRPLQTIPRSAARNQSEGFNPKRMLSFRACGPINASTQQTSIATCSLLVFHVLTVAFRSTAVSAYPFPDGHSHRCCRSEAPLKDIPMQAHSLQRLNDEPSSFISVLPGPRATAAQQLVPSRPLAALLCF